MPYGSDDPAVPPRNFQRACLLLLLHEHPAHGYDLLERLECLGFERDDPGRLYRTLRLLESEELVRSGWGRSEIGPARRTYELTPAGREELDHAASSLHATRDLLGAFLDRYHDRLEAGAD